jgi:hypothetical protein
LFAAGVAMGVSAVANAQIGPRVNEYPDVIVSSVGGSYDITGTNAIGNYGSANGWASYAIGSDSCNVGLNPAIWIDCTSGSFCNQHPVIGGEVYRLFNGRFEQIGMSWLKHGFCAADNCSTGSSSGGQQGCLNIAGSHPSHTGCQTDYRGNPATGGTGCDWLGAGRATDTYGSGLNGSQGYLGPRSEVNSWTGAFPYPYVRQGTNPSSCLNKRLLVRSSDLDPASYPRYNATTNPTGAQFFSEIVYIMTDEWPTERYNNYSTRKLVVGTTLTTPSGACGSMYAMDYATGAGNLTIPLKPAITQWKAVDPSVVLVTADAPNDGRFYVGAKVTELGNGTWQYEYAVFNMNSDRAAGSFSIPKAASSTVQINSLGFHAPEYHSGEPYAAKAWDMQVHESDIQFACEPYTTNANANAIRWSTLYNFRFIANQPPRIDPGAPVVLGLFKPGVQVTDAGSISVNGLPVPGMPSACRADFNNSGGVTTQDIFDFLNGWLAGNVAADFNGINGLEVQDIFEFLNAWFVGCP